MKLSRLPAIRWFPKLSSCLVLCLAASMTGVPLIAGAADGENVILSESFSSGSGPELKGADSWNMENDAAQGAKDEFSLTPKIAAQAGLTFSLKDMPVDPTADKVWLRVKFRLRVDNAQPIAGERLEIRFVHENERNTTWLMTSGVQSQLAGTATPEPAVNKAVEGLLTAEYHTYIVEVGPNGQTQVFQDENQISDTLFSNETFPVTAIELTFASSVDPGKTKWLLDDLEISTRPAQ